MDIQEMKLLEDIIEQIKGMKTRQDKLTKKMKDVKYEYSKLIEELKEDMRSIQVKVKTT